MMSMTEPNMHVILHTYSFNFWHISIPKFTIIPIAVFQGIRLENSKSLKVLSLIFQSYHITFNLKNIFLKKKNYQVIMLLYKCYTCYFTFKFYNFKKDYHVLPTGLNFIHDQLIVSFLFQIFHLIHLNISDENFIQLEAGL